MKWTHGLIVGLVIAFLFVVECFFVYRYYTTILPGGNDFYPRWAGAKAFILEGRDPYSLEVTKEIEAVLDPLQRRTNSFSFAFPLHVIVTFWPLVFVSYPWAQAIWMVTIQWMAIALLVVVLWRWEWRPSPLAAAALLFATLLFYPITRSFFLGQFTVHVTLLLALTMLFLHRRADGWAGICLALTTIKPQMVIFLGPWLVLWAIGQKRWRFLAGLLGMGGGVLLGSLLLFPRWPLAFVADLSRYAEVASGRNPLELLSESIWPEGATFIRVGLTVLLLGAMFWAWWWGRRADENTFELATYWTIAVGLLLPFQTGTTNQVMLFIPLFAWWWAAWQRWGKVMWLVAAAFLVILWVLFLKTIDNSYENPLMFLPLPFLSLAVLAGMTYTTIKRNPL
ncbi:MAG: DUF2029 domain-containing protein [Chloroflexi bacterium]|nr:DUF2029 domain-containing protein [Chloroflexota bacterium]MBP8054905.1 DUF2029 domain-containing protein [Chloroflexota bacterium]